ncbi:hypothetical protein RIF29_29277 [Crotalaria pallida]|uniref:Uncharacterized protein n=1 Tax=Crotalaria pallida TaxID=3830 RepID=A0AAN9EEP3_CROPI
MYANNVAWHGVATRRKVSLGSFLFGLSLSQIKGDGEDEVVWCDGDGVMKPIPRNHSVLLEITENFNSHTIRSTKGSTPYNYG